MGTNTRKIEIDGQTADLLEARAAARGISVSELLVDLAGLEAGLTPELQTMRREAEGPWAPDVLAEDARRLADFQRSGRAVPWEDVRAWMRSWGTPNELPPPKPRKL